MTERKSRCSLPSKSSERGGEREAMDTRRAAWKPSPSRGRAPKSAHWRQRDEPQGRSLAHPARFSCPSHQGKIQNHTRLALKVTQKMILFDYLFGLHLKNHLQNLKGKILPSLQNQKNFRIWETSLAIQSTFYLFSVVWKQVRHARLAQCWYMSLRKWEDNSAAVWFVTICIVNLKSEDQKIRTFLWC